MARSVFHVKCSVKPFDTQFHRYINKVVLYCRAILFSPHWHHILWDSRHIPGASFFLHCFCDVTREALRSHQELETATRLACVLIAKTVSKLRELYTIKSLNSRNSNLPNCYADNNWVWILSNWGAHNTWEQSKYSSRGAFFFGVCVFLCVLQGYKITSAYYSWEITVPFGDAHWMNSVEGRARGRLINDG